MTSPTVHPSSIRSWWWHRGALRPVLVAVTSQGHCRALEAIRRIAASRVTATGAVVQTGPEIKQGPRSTGIE